jgi:hypothetical protein
MSRVTKEESSSRPQGGDAESVDPGCTLGCRTGCISSAEPLERLYSLVLLLNVVEDIETGSLVTGASSGPTVPVPDELAVAVG